MAEKGFKRKLTAVLSADVVGYSRLMEEEDMTTVRNLRKYQKVFASHISQYRGRVVDSPGDNLLAEFKSAVDAVQCAVEIQRELAERNSKISANRKMEYRIGVNLGDVIQEGKKIYGDGINVAARLEALAAPGGICISGIVYDQVKKKLKLKYHFAGKKRVKNIEESVDVYQVIFLESSEPDGLIKANVEKMAFPLPEKPSIAVLPFTNMSGIPAQEYIGDGISENIINALSVGSAIFVIARNSTFTYKSRAVKVQDVAEDLGVRYVLEGSVQKSGDRLRVTAQLIDALTGHHLWSEKYDRKMGELFDLPQITLMRGVMGLRETTFLINLIRRITSRLESFWRRL
jgi:adenylate cyclase